MWINLYIYLLLFLLLPNLTFAAEPKIKNSTAAVHIADKEGRQLATGIGIILSEDGIMAANCDIVSKWFAKAEHILIVEMESGILYPMEDLISGRCDYNLALFKIPGRDLKPLKLKDRQEIRIGKLTVNYGTFTKLLDKYKITIKKIRQNSKSASFIPIKPPEISKQETSRTPASPQMPQPLIEPKEEIKKQEEQKPQTAEDYFKLAVSLEISGNIQEAVDAYKNTLKLKPFYYEASIRLGLLHYKAGRYGEAADSYISALQIKKDDPAVYKKLGSIYIITGQYEKAKNILKQAELLWPDATDIRYSLGIAYYLNGEDGKAAEEYVTLKGMDKELSLSLFEVLYK